MIELELKGIDKILSQNTYLLPSSRCSKVGSKRIRTHYLYKDPTVRSYQEYLEKYIKEHYTDYIREQVRFFDYYVHDSDNKLCESPVWNESYHWETDEGKYNWGTRKYKESFTFLMNKKLQSRDVTNCVKLVEDSIVRAEIGRAHV